MPNTMRGKNANFAALQVSTFYVGDYLFGIEVCHLQEVVRWQRATAVPLAPAALEGLVNLRGEAIPALDMRRRLQMEPRDAEEVRLSLIMRTDEGAVSLTVDDIGDVLDLEAGNREPPPGDLASDVKAVIRSVYRLNDSLLLILDADSALNIGSTAH